MSQGGMIGSKSKVSCQNKLSKLLQAENYSQQLLSSSTIRLFRHTETSAGISDDSKNTFLLLLENGSRCKIAGISIQNVISVVYGCG
jgi:ABC-type hemin transport system substrate-binding protein